MQIFSFGMSTTLALGGIGFAVFGILKGEFEPTAIGLVLILGAGVFATLYVGTRWVSRKPEENIQQRVSPPLGLFTSVPRWASHRRAASTADAPRNRETEPRDGRQGLGRSLPLGPSARRDSTLGVPLSRKKCPRPAPFEGHRQRPQVC